MRTSRRWLAIPLLLVPLALRAQVMTPQEITEPGAQRLQQKYLTQLMAIGTQAKNHHFPYPFYFSRLMDLDEKQQQKADQRSIRFDKFKGRTVLEITGNYYASYSSEQMEPGKRVRQTFLDVMLPLLEAAVPPLGDDVSIHGFALEISHHVRHKVLGVEAENAENVTLVLPREAAQKLVAATSQEQQQAALLDGQAYLDAQPVVLWLSEDAPPPPVKGSKKAEGGEGAPAESGEAAAEKEPETPIVSPRLVKGPEWPLRPDLNQETLGKLQAAHHDAITSMVAALDPQAHFVPYAPPSFIAFHKGAYLQISVETNLEAAAAGSQYKLAALAFDQHIAHLVRPVLTYLPEKPDFDGIDFSTTVKLPGGGASEAVEFFFPWTALRCFAQYDCTGQQLISSGFVLINGERAGLDLQSAEASH